MMRTLAIVALVVALVPSQAAADGSWLDQPLVNWNRVGMDLPQAPAMDPTTNPRCLNTGRPAETPADQALLDHGWTLFSSYMAGWDTVVVRALSGFDGMCRPLGSNVFVFVDGKFAGTLSPGLMDSRIDGTGDVRFFVDQNMLSAEFQRYGPDDPLCCPSSQVSVDYRIARRPGGPLVVPQSVGPG